MMTKLNFITGNHKTRITFPKSSSSTSCSTSDSASWREDCKGPKQIRHSLQSHLRNGPFKILSQVNGLENQPTIKCFHCSFQKQTLIKEHSVQGS